MYKDIDSNKRRTALLLGFFLVFVIAVGLVFRNRISAALNIPYLITRVATSPSPIATADSGLIGPVVCPTALPSQDVCLPCTGADGVKKQCESEDQARADNALKEQAAQRTKDMLKNQFDLQAQNLGYADTCTMLAAIAMALDTNSTIIFDEITNAHEVMNPITIALEHLLRTGQITQQQYEQLMNAQPPLALETLEEIAKKLNLSEKVVKAIKLVLTLIELRNFYQNLKIPGVDSVWSPPLTICKKCGGSFTIQFPIGGGEIGAMLGFSCKF